MHGKLGQQRGQYDSWANDKVHKETTVFHCEIATLATKQIFKVAEAMAKQIKQELKAVEARYGAAIYHVSEDVSTKHTQLQKTSFQLSALVNLFFYLHRL